jgi:hypothetical protein
MHLRLSTILEPTALDSIFPESTALVETLWRRSGLGPAAAWIIGSQEDLLFESPLPHQVQEGPVNTGPFSFPVNRAQVFHKWNLPESTGAVLWPSPQPADRYGARTNP